MFSSQDKSEKKEDSKEEPVDETAIKASDILIVMHEANCFRAAAVKALKKTKGDIVNAIMELTL